MKRDRHDHRDGRTHIEASLKELLMKAVFVIMLGIMFAVLLSTK